MLARQLPVSHLKPILRAGNSGRGGGGGLCVVNLTEGIEWI